MIEESELWSPDKDPENQFWTPEREAEYIGVCQLQDILKDVTDENVISSLLQNFKPFPHQRLILQGMDLMRFLIVAAGRRSGKTTIFAKGIVKKAMEFDWGAPENRNRLREVKPRYSVFTPAMKQGGRGVWEYISAQVRALGGIVTQEKQVLPNGAEIYLHGGQRPDFARGDHNDGVVFDEFAFMNPYVWDVVSPTLAEYNGFAWFISTVNMRNHFAQMFERAMTDPQWFAAIFPASIIKHLPQEELDRLRAEMGEHRYAQEMECDFDAPVKGSFWGEEINKVRKQNRCGAHGHLPNRGVYVVMDLGVRDDCAIWWFQLHRGSVRWIAHKTFSGKSLEFLMEQLREIKRERGYVYATCFCPFDIMNRESTRDDGTGNAMTRHDFIRPMLHEMGFKGLQVVPKSRKQDLIDSGRAIMAHSIFNTADREVERGLNALAMYEREWDDKLQNFKQNPLHNWASHPADSYQYAAHMIRTQMDEMEDSPEKEKTSTGDPIRDDINRELMGHNGGPPMVAHNEEILDNI